MEHAHDGLDSIARALEGGPIRNNAHREELGCLLAVHAKGWYHLAEQKGRLGREGGGRGEGGREVMGESEKPAPK